MNIIEVIKNLIAVGRVLIQCLQLQQTILLAQTNLCKKGHDIHGTRNPTPIPIVTIILCDQVRILSNIILTDEIVHFAAAIVSKKLNSLVVRLQVRNNLGHRSLFHIRLKCARKLMIFMNQKVFDKNTSFLGEKFGFCLRCIEEGIFSNTPGTIKEIQPDF